MSSESLGLLIGGIVPAFAFGLSGVFVKASNQAGIGVGPYLIAAGLAVAFCGVLFLVIFPDRTISLKSGSAAFAMGFLWAIGAGLVAIAVSRLGAPIAKLVPLYNTNTLVAVLLTLWIFAEWKQVQPLKLLAGSALIMVGSVFVSRA